MAGKGPLPKVAGKRQRRSKRRVVKLIPRSEKAPAPHAKWLKDTQAKWEIYWDSPLSQVVDQRTDLIAILRFFSLVDLRERAYRSYMRTPFLTGYKGQKVVNPQGRMMLQMDTELRLLGDRLGLDPAARLRLGIESEPDETGGLDEEWTADDVDGVKDPRLKVVK